MSVDELRSFFDAQYPDAKPEIYNGLFVDLQAANISPDIADAVFAEVKRKQLLLKLSEKAYAASQGLASIQDVQSLVSSFAEGHEDASTTETYVTTDLEEIVNAVVKTPGIRFRLDCLNRSLGSLRTGDFGFIFARPETGKTTFLADIAAGAFDQVQQPVVWFNNEEEGRKVMLRVYQAYFGCTLDQLLANVKAYKAKFAEQVGDKFKLIDSAQIDRSLVEKVLQGCNPSLIIYDQIDKIKGFKADRDDLVYGAIYQWARELAKSYAPSIGVCQADGTAEGQRWLSMANVANAKTSKQAEADWILGIGKTHDEAAEYIRYLNISKNKLIGDEDSIAELRHGRFEVLIEPTIARYKDIVNYE